jgi:hypothetical protein
MDELGLSESMFVHRESVDMLHIKYCAIIIVLVVMCVFCKNYKIDRPRYYRGKMESIV